MLLKPLRAAGGKQRQSHRSRLNCYNRRPNSNLIVKLGPGNPLSGLTVCGSYIDMTQRSLKSKLLNPTPACHQLRNVILS